MLVVDEGDLKDFLPQDLLHDDLGIMNILNDDDLPNGQCIHSFILSFVLIDSFFHSYILPFILIGSFFHSFFLSFLHSYKCHLF